MNQQLNPLSINYFLHVSPSILFLEAINKLYPFNPKTLAIPLPIPFDAPVMKTVLLVFYIIILIYFIFKVQSQDCDQVIILRQAYQKRSKNMGNCTMKSEKNYQMRQMHQIPQQNPSLNHISQRQNLQEQQHVLNKLIVDSLCVDCFRQEHQNLIMNVGVGKRPSKEMPHSAQNHVIDCKHLRCLPISEPQGKVDGEDKRTIVKNNDRYPFSPIGCLVAYFDTEVKVQNSQAQNSRKFGTGFIIYKNFILTCAHVVYNRETKQKATHGYFYPAIAGRGIIEYKVDSQKIHLPQEYKTCHKQNVFQYDYAVIQITVTNNEDLSQAYGCFGINTLVYTDSQAQLYGYLDNQTLEKRKLNDKDRTIEQSSEVHKNIYIQQKWLVGMQGLVKQCEDNKRFVQYLIQTDPGQSGGPIIRKIAHNNYQVIALHQRFVQKQNGRKYNSGIKISQLKPFINKIIKMPKNHVSINNRRFEKNCLGDVLKYCHDNYRQTLTMFDLSSNRNMDQNLKGFRMPGTGFCRLKTLNLSKNQITDQGIAYLTINENRFNALQCLILSINLIGQKGISHLITGHKCFPILLKLFLDENLITPKALQILCSKYKQSKYENKAFPLLDFLQIGGNYQSHPSKNGNLKQVLDAFPNLTQFSCRKNFTKDKGFVNFANREKLKNLSLINFGNNYITGAGLKQFTGHSLSRDPIVFSNLTRLWLQYNEIDGQSVSCLANRRCFPVLIELQIFFNNLQEKGMRNLMKTANQFPILEIINLAGNSIGKEGCMHLSVGSSAMPKLKHLILDNNYISDQGVNNLVNIKEIKLFPDLINLSLVKNQLTWQSVKFLMYCGYFRNLKRLDLSSNKIRDEGFNYFCNDPEALLITVFEKLQFLILNDNQITSAGFQKFVIHKKPFSHLRKIGMAKNKLKSEVSQYLIKNKQSIFNQMPKLTNILLINNEITPQSFTKLQKYFGEDKISFSFHD